MRKEADQQVAPQRDRKKRKIERERERGEVIRAGINKCRGELMKISW